MAISSQARKPFEKHAQTDVPDLCFDDASTFPLKRLLCFARQSGEADPEQCALTLLLLSTGRVLRNALQKAMKPLGMSEARFLSLVTLYSLDPAPSCPANLAYHVEITRTAMTDTLDQMEKLGWVRRVRQKADRRVIHIHLTESGRQAAASAIGYFLRVAGALASGLSPLQRKTLHKACGRVRENADCREAHA